MKLSDQIDAARPSGFWIASAIAVLIMCLGFITLSGASRDSLKLAALGFSGALLCLIGSVLYTRKELRALVAKVRAQEEWEAARKSEDLRATLDG